jgi:DNA-binding IclR family transcriptional regulator
MREKLEREPSVTRALRVLHLVAERGGARLRDIADELEVPQSTVHRLLSTLEETGHVVRPPGTGHRPYLPGRALFDVAIARDHAEDGLMLAATRYLEELVDEFAESIHVSVLRGAKVRFLDGRESPRSLRLGLRRGQEMCAHRTSVGRAMLAELPDATVARILGARAEAPGAPIWATLEETRERGYAVNLGDADPDVTAVGAAVVDPMGRVRGALSVAGPSCRVPATSLEWIGTSLREKARLLAGELA